MKYLDYRKNIQSGDLLSWTHRGWGSIHSIVLQVIRFVTRSEYVHVGVAWVHNDRVFVIEAVDPYVRIMPLSNLLACYVTHTPHYFSKEAEEYVFSLVGTAKYSYMEAIKSVFKLNKDPDKWQCAELVRSIFKANKIDLNCIDTPSELVLAIQKLGGSTMYLE